jgi:CDP-diacylglycerol---glycerol-3-phosphate 3-phosphatidyltransferase
MITLPTWITLSRLLVIPGLLYGLYQPAQSARWLCLGLFLLAAGTDWLDGYLARKLNQVTDLGKFLDPLVDKLLILAPLLILTELGRVPGWGVFLILARELAIAGWRVNQPVITGANWGGKLKTSLQIAAVALLIAPLPTPWQFLPILMFWAAVVWTIASGILYLLPTSGAATAAPKS